MWRSMKQMRHAASGLDGDYILQSSRRNKETPIYPHALGRSLRAFLV